MKICFILSLLICFSANATIEYSRLDPDHLINPAVLQKTYQYYMDHLAGIKNKKFMGIVDFKEHNSKERFFIIDMDLGLVETFLVAHGINSDPDFTGYATIFSNVIDSYMSSIGFYMTAETYEGTHGYSLRLDGLESTNSNARERGIVLHAAEYVAPGPKIGRSFGCPALEIRYHQHVIDELKEGALLFLSFE